MATLLYNIFFFNQTHHITGSVDCFQDILTITGTLFFNIHSVNTLISYLQSAAVTLTMTMIHQHGRVMGCEVSWASLVLWSVHLAFLVMCFQGWRKKEWWRSGGAETQQGSSSLSVKERKSPFPWSSRNTNEVSHQILAICIGLRPGICLAQKTVVWAGFWYSVQSFLSHENSRLTSGLAEV